jgi:hypothetical protein
MIFVEVKKPINKILYDCPEKHLKHKRNNSEEIEYVKLKLKNFKTLFFFIIILRRKLNCHNSNPYSLIC